MHQAPNTSLLIIDEQTAYAEKVAGLLRADGHNVRVVSDPHSAIDLLRGEYCADFVLANRCQKGEAIEVRQLESLSRAGGTSFILVYTKLSTLDNEEIYGILSKGAIRVLDEQVADRLVKDAKRLIVEFDELSEISGRFKEIMGMRSNVPAALVGKDVSVTITDSQYACWFTTPGAGLSSVGGPQGPCWVRLYNYPVSAGPCWGCVIADVLESGHSIDRLGLFPDKDESLGWVSIWATPIKSASEDRVIAVREAARAATEERLRELGFAHRLNKIAQGLIHIGFGRARIYTILGESRTILRAAAARTDRPDSMQGLQMEELGDTEVDYRKCPYAYEAVRSGTGCVVRNWDQELGPSPMQKMLDLQPPYLIVPVWGSDQSLLALIYADFVALSGRYREDILRKYANEGTLTRLQESYGAEVRIALEDSDGRPETAGTTG